MLCIYRYSLGGTTILVQSKPTRVNKRPHYTLLYINKKSQSNFTQRITLVIIFTHKTAPSPSTIFTPSLDRPRSPPRTASRSSQPFCLGTLSGQTDRQTDRHALSTYLRAVRSVCGQSRWRAGWAMSDDVYVALTTGCHPRRASRPPRPAPSPASTASAADNSASRSRRRC